MQACVPAQGVRVGIILAGAGVGRAVTRQSVQVTVPDGLGGQPAAVVAVGHGGVATDPSPGQLGPGHSGSGVSATSSAGGGSTGSAGSSGSTGSGVLSAGGVVRGRSGVVRRAGLAGAGSARRTGSFGAAPPDGPAGAAATARAFGAASTRARGMSLTAATTRTRLATPATCFFAARSGDAVSHRSRDRERPRRRLCAVHQREQQRDRQHRPRRRGHRPQESPGPAPVGADALGRVGGRLAPQPQRGHERQPLAVRDARFLHRLDAHAAGAAAGQVLGEPRARLVVERLVLP